MAYPTGFGEERIVLDKTNLACYYMSCFCQSSAPLETKQQITKLTQDLTLKQKENIFFRNLENIFKDWRGFNHRSG